MIRHGEAPYLECSSKGDKRFSAFYAIVNGHSIERRYQTSKKFGPGVRLKWNERQGLKPTNPVFCRAVYGALWDVYIHANPELLDVLRAAPGLSDVFGKEGHCCQATELWRIRNDEKI
jgi:hypothetical protein